MRPVIPVFWRPLLLFTALALWPGLLQDSGGPAGHLLLFVVCGLGLVPLAVGLSNLVERLVARLGPRLGGLLSVLLGNIVEFLVAFNALSSGLYPLVAMSIAGAVVINCLPVLGIGIMIACRDRDAVPLDPINQELANQQLLISAILLALPSVFINQPISDALQGNSSNDSFSLYSTLVAVLALIVYGLGVLQGQRGAAAPYKGAEPPTEESQARVPLLPLLVALTGLIALTGAVSERLVGSLDLLVEGAHLSPLFVGLFLLPLFGCLPEALVAWRAAARRDTPLLITSTIESSLQLLLFVLPLLVLCGLPLGRHLHLGLPSVALAALAIAMVMIERITANHSFNSFEGVQLIALFAALALGSLLLINPEAAAASGLSRLGGP
ncbi:MAG: calcium:proton antiporter [Cyanobacteria bacterium K_DeepCast_0m_m1_088]|nr:calcium:proton antiporter [Cyanobacteria bacterium K_DeepCast_0m_m1_088]